MDLSSLNKKQKEAVEFNGKHVLVLAGAGSGKTKTIVSRAAYLISKGVNSRNIQILSFTKKSAGEIVSRVNSTFPNSEAKSLNGNTFHSWCTSIIKSNPKVFSFHDFSVIDEDDRINVFKLICGKNKEILKATTATPAKISAIFSYALNTRKNLTEAIKKIIYEGQSDVDDEIQKYKHLYAKIIKLYIDYKKEHKYLDYDDLLDGVVTALKDNDEARKYISSKYKHILVDEMQDTNPLQWALLLLFQKNSHLFCVGDDAQSIYAFRGADFKNVHSFKDRVPDSEVLYLEDNYRSTQEILDVSNWLLEQSNLNYNKKLNAVRGKGDKPILMNFDSDYDEADWIAEDLLTNKVEESKLYSDHLILSRGMFGLKKIEAVFLDKNIPYKVFGGTQLLQSKHIRDVLSALRVVANIQDEVAWIRYLQLWDGIGEAKASKFITDILKCSNIEECIESLRKQSIRNSQLIKTLEAIKYLNNKPSEAIQKALDNMKERLRISTDNWDKREPDFKILMQMANKKTTINEFITEFILDPKLNESYIEGSEDKDCVILSTIHSAKGLEADICYVVNVSPGAYPSKISITGGDDAIEEERRCLYVALTRAKNKLVVTRNTASIQTYDGGNNGEELYFFNKLPDDLFENKTDTHMGTSGAGSSSYKGSGILFDTSFDFS